MLQPIIDRYADIGSGTESYYWYSLQKIHAGAGENVTLATQLEHILVYLRGGMIVPSHKSADTNKHMRMNLWEFITQQRRGERRYVFEGRSFS
jgi:alpha-glucosidase